MKRVLLLLACLLAARIAAADGSDLRIWNCVGEQVAGSGMPLPLALMFRPHDDIADLVSIQATLHLVGPTAGTMYDYVRYPASLTIVRAAPEGCEGFADVWSADGAIASAVAERLTPDDLVLHVTCARPTGIAVAAGQPVFGGLIQLGADAAAQPYYYDSSVSIESVVPWSQASGAQTTLTGGWVYLVGGLPAKRTSWGRIKSLYR